MLTRLRPVLAPGARTWISGALITTVLAGCAAPTTSVSTAPPPEAAPPPATPPPATPKAPPTPSADQSGQASWYGEPHHGRPTASGEIYDMNKLTAAHRTLPLGTRVLVTNLKNGRSVEVRINDRGPSVASRIIDVSFAAAEQLGAVDGGTFPARIHVLSTPSP